MAIASRLKDLVEQLDGAQAAAIVDEDGLTVESYRHPDSDVETESLSAECNTVVARARDAASRLQFGAVAEVVVVTEQYHLLCSIIEGGYYLFLVLRRDAILGKGRFFLQKTAFAMRAEI